MSICFAKLYLDRNEKPYACATCGAKFARKDSAYRHERSVHKAASETQPSPATPISPTPPPPSTTQTNALDPRIKRQPQQELLPGTHNLIELFEVGKSSDPEKQMLLGDQSLSEGFEAILHQIMIVDDFPSTWYTIQ